MAHATQHHSRKKRTRIPHRVGPTRLGREGFEKYCAHVKSGRATENSYVLLVGLQSTKLADIVESIKAGLPFSAFDRLVANTTLASSDAISLIDIPARTLTRRKQEGRFPRDESDRLLRASRIFAAALSLFEGNAAAAKHWLGSPQKALGGQTPLELSRTEVGAIEVERLVGRLEHGVFP